jgi:hypothetical protein
VLFEQNFHDWFVLFGQSLIKAYAFVDGLIPDAHDRDQWTEYARAKLSSKSKVSKPEMPGVIYHDEAEPEPMELEDGKFDKYSNVQEPWSGLDTSELYEAKRDPGDGYSKTYSRKKVAKGEKFGSNDQDQLSGAVYYNEPEEGSSAKANTHQRAWPSTVSDSQGQPAGPTYGSKAYYDSGHTYTTGGYGTATGETWSGSANDTPLLKIILIRPVMIDQARMRRLRTVLWLRTHGHKIPTVSKMSFKNRPMIDSLLMEQITPT